MTASAVSPHEHRVLRATLQTGRQIGDWPVLDYVHQELLERGIDARAVVRGMDDRLIRFERPLQRSTPIRTTAEGWEIGEPESVVVHDGLISAVRCCADLVRHEKPSSPTRPRELVVAAVELWRPRAPWELRVVGLLLSEIPGFGEVTWDRGDQASPFKIELDPLVVCEYGSVGSLEDLLAVNPGQPLHAVA